MRLLLRSRRGGPSRGRVSNRHRVDGGGERASDGGAARIAWVELINWLVADCWIRRLRPTSSCHAGRLRVETWSIRGTRWSRRSRAASSQTERTTDVRPPRHRRHRGERRSTSRWTWPSGRADRRARHARLVRLRRPQGHRCDRMPVLRAASTLPLPARVRDPTEGQGTRPPPPPGGTTTIIDFADQLPPKGLVERSRRRGGGGREHGRFWPSPSSARRSASKCSRRSAT